MDVPPTHKPVEAVQHERGKTPALSVPFEQRLLDRGGAHGPRRDHLPPAGEHELHWRHLGGATLLTKREEREVALYLHAFRNI